MAATAHIHLTPVTQADLDLARWADDGGPAAPDRPEDAEWRRIAAELSRRLPELCGREDVLVLCPKGTRSGAPACFDLLRAELDLDNRLFAPLDPASIIPRRAGDEVRYPIAWGAFLHEAAHAAHTRWKIRFGAPGTALLSAADLLEESRAERAHLARRPTDRDVVRAAIDTLVKRDIDHTTPSDPWHAACAAGLILARRDAGIFDPDETQALQDTVTGILGAEVLDTLAGIWNAAHATADEDHEAMRAHATAWCKALNTDPDSPPPAPDTTAPAGELREAVGKATGPAQEQARAQARVAAARAARQQAKADQAAQARRAAELAKKVFTPARLPYLPRLDATGIDPSPVTGTRAPTRAEKAAAGQLARALRAAAYRERTTTITHSQAPPGRLNMRGALARDAQRAAGATPTATPWTRTTHRTGPTPPLRVGIAVDVSGSMHAATRPIASAAWILAHAVTLTDPDSRSATIAYDRTLTAITTPARAPRAVTEFAAQGKGHRLAEAIDALTSGIGLTQPGAGRLLVIASDGLYSPNEATHATQRITAARNAGCAVLWLAFAPHPHPLPGTTLLELSDPTQAPAAIANAATKALATNHT
ncbi:hypothetical protein ACTWP5_29465 [Streptomyces sp. 4N509B]|uniref:hypothetical protein n=1 Tax=Streptomyces sp. 4N509B TaxID=3457413 RepID=UPI003FD2436D